ncbi:MAG: hypothetical protein ACKV2T_07890 [Kofleriaceae bacterium]
MQEHVVELEAKTELSKADAEAQMAERCGPGKYTIVRDGEEIVLKETVYRIHYRCN